MCGIAGYISKNSSKVQPSLLEAMANSMAHRGPDGSGIWLSPCKTVGLAHRRLSIVDTSNAGLQPMIDHEQRVVISFNGEIYNHKTLRTELEALGYHYRSHTDTETILYAYLAWGIACIERFEGMFAFALYDVARDEMYLVRDRIGIKPLYFSLMGSYISFASEIKALWHLPFNIKKSNAQGVYHYLTYLATPVPMTIYEKIYKLPPGYYLKIDTARHVSFTQWYALGDKITSQHCSEQESIQQLTHLLQTSVKKRLMADVAIGTFLSGGVDSSLITALVAQHQKPSTFTIAWAHDANDERLWARKVAQHFATDHHEIVINERDAFNFFQSMVHYQDEPLGDPVCIPLYYVARLLKDSGMTVALVGEGADELFGGYASYVPLLRNQKLFYRTQKLLPSLLKRGLYQASIPLLRQVSKRDLINRWATNQHLFYSSAVVFPQTLKDQFFHMHDGIDVDEEVLLPFAPVYLSQNSYQLFDYCYEQAQQKKLDFLQTIALLELQHRLPELLLMRVDKMTMASSVEARVPFLDHHVVEYALMLEQEFKYKQGQTKYLLKKVAEQFLPHDIIYRQKVGFNAPTTDWFMKGTYFKSYFYDLLASKRGKHEFLNIDVLEKIYHQVPTHTSPQLWALLNLLANDTIA